MPPFPPQDRGILSWPWWIDCASPSCALPRGPKVQRVQNREPGTGTGRGALHRLLLVCFSRQDPRRFQCAVPHWQSPGQIVFVSQEPTSRPPRAWNSGGGFHGILPTGRPLYTISRRRAAQWRGAPNEWTSCSKPSAHLILKLKEKNHWSLLSEASPSSHRRNTATPLTVQSSSTRLPLG
jgi:hypothetical protein